MSQPLTNYLTDLTHTNPGYSYSYTNSLIYTCDFPNDANTISELESEITVEAQERTRAFLDGYDEGPTTGQPSEEGDDDSKR